jgi:hypothetical protein
MAIVLCLVYTAVTWQRAACQNGLEEEKKQCKGKGNRANRNIVMGILREMYRYMALLVIGDHHPNS